MTATTPSASNESNISFRFAGDEMTAHGFRAMAGTLLDESGKWQPDAIERALAHQERDQVRAAYGRGMHWNERVTMAQWWSDHLDQLRDTLGGDEVGHRGGITTFSERVLFMAA